MAPLEQADKDAITAHVLQQLSQTQYACSTLDLLGSRDENSVYRGVLTQPITTAAGATEASIIVKHSTDFAVIDRDLPLEQVFTASVMNAIAEFSAPTATETTIIKAPRLYLFNREANIQVLEDFTETKGFKLTLFSPNAAELLPPSSPAAIGHQLGSWLRSFHTWASAPDRAALRAQIGQSEPFRKLKYQYTFDGFLKVLSNYPELLEGHEKVLESIQDAAAKEFEKLPTEGDENWGLIHGDFWSGNILIQTTPWKEPLQSGGPNKLFIIDWEFAQFGHRSYDLGQLIGDLYERKLFNSSDITVPVLEGVIAGYGELSDEMAFRTAIYVGVHLCGWYNRRPRRGPWVPAEEAIQPGLKVGRDFILKGWERDRAFFESTILAGLFAPN
ncbi:kinase-like domain-containing protein [Xylariales sp. PMI_506]|nr:kinase-like domain-containing protein [Xylariales sp. PMI_506]